MRTILTQPQRGRGKTVAIIMQTIFFKAISSLMKIVTYNSNFTQICSQGYHWKLKAIVGSDNGLAALKRRWIVIIWSNGSLSFWRIYASVGLDFSSNHSITLPMILRLEALFENKRKNETIHKFHNDWTTETDFMDERELREYKMSFGGLSYRPKGFSIHRCPVDFRHKRTNDAEL